MPAHRLPFPTAPEFEGLAMPVPMAGCWLWLGNLDRHGYGFFVRSRQRLSTHRYAWTLYRGAIPAGLQVLHHCDTRSYVNPDHLFVGSHTDNMRDMWSKRDARNGGTRLRLVRCARGHLMAGGNLYITPRGKRNCAACRLIATNAYRARKAA